MGFIAPVPDRLIDLNQLIDSVIGTFSAPELLRFSCTERLMK